MGIACEFIKLTPITATLLLLVAMKAYTLYSCGSIPDVPVVLRIAPWGTLKEIDGFLTQSFYFISLSIKCTSIIQYIYRYN